MSKKLSNYKYIKIFKFLIPLFFGLFLLSGCDYTSSGIFLDSTVEGLSYSTPTLKGVTDAGGTFDYSPGELVTFSVGNVELGSAMGADVITPVDLVEGGTTSHQAVINIARLLQSLDADGDNNNGIQISRAIRKVIESEERNINFGQTANEFAADSAVTDLLADLNAAYVFKDLDPRDRFLKPAAQAMDHLVATLSDRIIVNTKYGKLKGYGPTDGTWQWLGIPYAKAPVGNLRWRPPVNIKPWKGIREATAWGNQAAQPLLYESFGLGGMSEDCLYLNITAPRDAKDLPVMVYFHGGGFSILTNNVKSFNNPTSLPTKDVVLVTVNHRLGPFGYIAHPELSKESCYGGSGNYGQMDLIAALNWVQKNIMAFGGNPGNVTIFGESGGGGKVQHLLACSKARGLFHKAIIQSGFYNPETRSLADAEAAGEALAAALGVDGEADVLAAMRAKSWVEIIAQAPTDLSVGPNVDGFILPDTVRNIVEAGKHNDVPLISGANREDMVLLVDLMINEMPWWADNFKSNVYAYVFGHVMTGWAAAGGVAYHGIELIYVFNYPASAYVHHALGLSGLPAGTPPPLGWCLADIGVVDSMMSMWTNFARTGDPGISGVIDWTPYTSSGDNYLEIGQGGTLEMETGVADAF